MVIFLTGPDEYRSHERWAQLRQAFRDKYDPDGLNTVELDPNSKVEDIRNALITGGLFGGRRFVAINHLEQMTADGLQHLNTILQPVLKSNDCIVVLREIRPAATKRGSRARVAKRKNPGVLLGGAKTEHFDALTPAQKTSLVVKIISDQGSKISREAAIRLSAYCEEDTWRLAQESKKLALFAAGRLVTVEDVDHLVSAPARSDIFGLTDAVGLGQTGKALTLLTQELAAGTHPLALISTLAYHIELLYRVQGALHQGEKTAASIATRLKIHPYVAQKAIVQARRFQDGQLREWHHHLVDIDREAKSSALDPETLLDLLIIKPPGA